jgi:hypothetical protein
MRIYSLTVTAYTERRAKDMTRVSTWEEADDLPRSDVRWLREGVAAGSFDQLAWEAASLGRGIFGWETVLQRVA